MPLRAILPAEQQLIAHLLRLAGLEKRYTIPSEVENLGDSGLQLSSRGEHAADLVEAEYKDADGREVLITLTSNEHGELFELDLWKADFSDIRQYPVPEKVRLS